MLGILGILVSLLLLIVLAYRGWNVILIAPICALVALLLGDFDAPVLATYTQVFMPALGNYLIKFFPLFLLGAVFGKLMDDSGCARTIAHRIVEWTGKERAIIAIILACGVLTYGGVSLFVVAFAVFPVAIQMFREGNLPKRLIPATIALGSFTFTMSALPGSPAIQNAIPMPYFHTDAFAAPGLGFIAGVVMFVCGSLWLMLRARRARAAGEGYGDEAVAAAATSPASPSPGEMPSFAVAITPVILVLAINFVFSKYVIVDLDTSYLATPKYGKTTLSAVGGTWAIIVAMLTACVVLIALTWKRFQNVRQSLNDGALGSMLPILNVGSEVAYGGVIASLAAFAIIKDWLMGVTDNPVIGLAVIVNVLAGITGSASGGMSIALQAVGQQYLELAQAAGLSPQILHRVAALASGGLDALPHNGAVITLLAICGLNHRQSYFDIFMVAVAFPLLSMVLVIVLNGIFGTF
ncbi:GntP family permease [Accumulibacter sp.]|uniref:GntP family permease n=1 Tax=Accumulibacter sp. TaxID=2053492 RepID=UPI0025E8DA72|nr:GntP family permease [Accumulibacter sp.]MCM8612926.1 GntP family permease [Accumulibacter sp.]MCM8636615.1 GntP family permease [Accumulibacter sp.]MCM8639409.1 GntP family permease [Accumulibacter sp.]